jgi:hypothetical protein
MTAKRRPTAVTAIGRLILISGILGGIIAVTWVVGVRVSPDFRRIMLTYNSPLTLPWAMVGSVVFIASGAGMLRGAQLGARCLSRVCPRDHSSWCVSVRADGPRCRCCHALSSVPGAPHAASCGGVPPRPWVRGERSTQHLDDAVA